MSKSLSPDPMAREVDRLLAQLARVGSPGGRESSRTATRPKVTVGSSSAKVPSRGDLVALWARLALGGGLGGLMTQWPYPHGCGWPLLGYAGAVATVLLAGGWIALASWKLRSGAAHVLALILFFWGIVLAGEQVLPRVGYAAERASWRCSSASSAADEAHLANQ